jgi:hypothetical protein
MPDAMENDLWNDLFTWRESQTKRSADAGITENRVLENREVREANLVEEGLGSLANLPGVWNNLRPTGPSPLEGRGWNLIALPFASQDAIAPFGAGNVPPYRLLMNRYNEQLVFLTVDENVPNRGITQDRSAQADQRVATLDYEQTIRQIAADDMPQSGVAGPPDIAIHHEPGLFLCMKDQLVDGFDIARVGTIPHGNALNAIGRSAVVTGPPTIGDLSGFPEGVTTDIVEAVDTADAASPNPRTRYLFAYKHFLDNPFLGLFDPGNANALLQGGLPPNVLTTTILDFSTENDLAGIVNIPFVERQADASQMRSVFWVMELDEPAPFEGLEDTNRMVLAYSQFIYLDFFPRFDGKPGLIRWPHISINMMEKVAPPPSNTAVPSTDY